MARSTDASIAFSVTDNLSESVVKMKNAITSTKQDAEQLQKTLDLLTNTKMQLKNVDLKNTQAELARTKKAFEELGESATEAEREAARADFEQANRNYENVRGQLEMVSKRARQTTKDLLDATGAISKADNRAETSGSAGVLSALGRAGLLEMAGDTAGAWANFLVGSTLVEGTLNGEPHFWNQLTADGGAHYVDLTRDASGTTYSAADLAELGYVWEGMPVSAENPQ